MLLCDRVTLEFASPSCSTTMRLHATYQASVSYSQPRVAYREDEFQRFYKLRSSVPGMSSGMTWGRLRILDQ